MQSDSGSRGMVPTRWRPAVTLGALGFVSGIVTPILGFDIGQLGSLGSISYGDNSKLPFGLGPAVRAFLPLGLGFAIAIALGVSHSIANYRAIPVLVGTTMLAWTAVVTIAWSAAMQGAFGGLALITGAIGAVLTHLGCSIYAPHLRQPALIGLTGFAGVATAMIFALGPNLFPFWQGAVAFCIGVGLGSRGEEAVPAAAGSSASAGTGSPAAAEAKSPGAAEPAIATEPAPPVVPEAAVATEPASPVVTEAPTVAEGRSQEAPPASVFARLFGARRF